MKNDEGSPYLSKQIFMICCFKDQRSNSLDVKSKKESSSVKGRRIKLKKPREITKKVFFIYLNLIKCKCCRSHKQCHPILMTSVQLKSK